MNSYMDLDKNNIANTTIGEYDVKWYDVKKAPFSLHGFYNPETEPFFRRLPPDVAAKTSTAVDRLSRESAGGRVRFSTDSDYVAIKCVLPMVRNFSHMPRTGASGFDLYEVNDGVCTYVKTFVPPKDVTDGYESIAKLDGKKMRSFEINFPLYNRVDELYVGVREARLWERAQNTSTRSRCFITARQ